MEPLLRDISVFPFRGSRKNVRIHITCLFVTSIEGTSLFRGKEHFFWVPKPGFNLHLEDVLIRLTAKFDDKFKCSLVTIATAFKHEISLLENAVLHL